VHGTDELCVVHRGCGAVWLFDRDSTLRRGWVGAFFLAAILVAASIATAFAKTPWALLGLPPALLMAFANLKLRDVHTYREAMRWLLLVGLGMACSFALLMSITR
jgi:hypothetical protein